MHSKTWCPIPFIAMSYHPMGSLTRCMMSDQLMSNDLDWDNQEFQDLRQSMLDGKWDWPGCRNCKLKEEIGIKSQRQNWLNGPVREKFVKDAYDNPKLTGNKIRHLFLNFNNICNFKCRMCSPKYSNSLIPERNHLNKTLDKQLKNLLALAPEHQDRVKNINDVESFLEKHKDNLKDLTQIWITGGEPFIGDTLWKVRDLLYNYAKPENIYMTITTNGSKVDVDKLQSLDRFKMINLDLSIDAVGPMFEYMRSAGLFTWSEMQNRINEICDFNFKNNSWFKFAINSSYQIYNALTLKEFYTYIRNTEKEYDFHITRNQRVLIGPEYLQARHLPRVLKEITKAEIEELLQDRTLTNVDVKNINDCKNMLEKPQDKDMWKAFKLVCKEQDTYRKMHLKDYSTRLSKFIYD